MEANGLGDCKLVKNVSDVYTYKCEEMTETADTKKLNILFPENKTLEICEISFYISNLALDSNFINDSSHCFSTDLQTIIDTDFSNHVTLSKHTCPKFGLQLPYKVLLTLISIYFKSKEFY